MIAFDFECSNGHHFEGWFDDARAYEEQRENGMIACPVCNDAAVAKVPSTFGIKRASGEQRLPASREEAMAVLGRQLVQYIDENFEDVGADFHNEALKIHYGNSEPRNIRGYSSKAQEKILKEEGVSFFKIPIAEAEDS